MEPIPSPPRVLRFGVFDLDLKSGELRKSGVRQRLVGQPFEVLRALLENPQQIVTREELRRRLWPEDTFVNYDLALKKAINRIREVLGDSAESPRFVETVPRRGYRFIAAVDPNDRFRSSALPGLPQAEEVAIVSSRRRFRIVAVSAALVTTAAILGLSLGRSMRRVLDASGPLTTVHSGAALVHPVDSIVLQAYLRANYHLRQFSRGFGDHEKEKAAQYFQEAIDADPSFAPAYVGMSNAHYASIRREDVRAEVEAAEKAVELNPNLSDGWSRVAQIRYDSWDWQGAEQAYRRAILLNPSNASAHDGLCHLLDATGHMDLGMTECETAQQLEPTMDHISYALFKRHQYDRAIQVLLMMLRIDPNSGYLHHKLYENYAAKGMYAEAVPHLAKTAELFGFPNLAADLRKAFTTSGYEGAMREYARNLEQLSGKQRIFLPVNIAAVYAALGEKDRAFYWLEQAYSRRGEIGAGISVTELGVYPPFTVLHSDPRFKDLLRRLRLPQ